MYPEALKELEKFNQYEAAKEALAKHNQGVRVPEPEQPKIKKRADGSLREENIENGNELTKIHYWNNAGPKPVVRTKLYYQKDRPNEARAYIHMLPISYENTTDRKTLEKEKNYAVETAIDDFTAMKDNHKADIIVDFHGIDKPHEIHFEAIKAIQAEIATQGVQRKIKITGISPHNKKALDAIKDAFKTKDEAKKIVVLPPHHSQDPDIFDAGIPARREEFDERGNLVFREYYDENGRSEKIVKVNNRAVETPIPDSNMGREFVPYNSDDLSVKETGRKK
jgi:hypothetical protein